MKMRISEEMCKTLNAQYNEEHANDAMYQAMANWASANGYRGVAAWFNNQANEEREHAGRFKGYMESVFVDVVKEAVPAPRTEFKNVTELFEAGIEAEQNTTDNIFAIFKQAMKEEDLFTLDFIKHFIAEQREEESSFEGMLRFAKKDEKEDYMNLDHVCAARK